MKRLHLFVAAAAAIPFIASTHADPIKVVDSDLVLRIDHASLRAKKVDMEMDMGVAWLATAQAFGKDGSLVSQAPIVVGGCERNQLGPFGRLASFNGMQAIAWKPEGERVIDLLARAVCDAAAKTNAERGK